MADKEHLAKLKEGVEAWNKWRKENPDVVPDLRGARANLWRAYLGEANLVRADLRGANLRGANLEGAILLSANLGRANLEGAKLAKATFAYTSVDYVDLSTTIGLDEVSHIYPSSIGVNTIFNSKGKIPDVFLRGCGVPDIFIEYMPSLVQRPIQYYSCFISYCHKDEDFAKRLHADLQDNGVRCWFAPEDMKIGDRVLDTVDNAIRLRDKLIIILSESSIKSDWVEHEVSKALEEEKNRKTTVLFPLRVDDSVMETEFGWAKRIRVAHKPGGRHIGNFCGWKEHSKYKEGFDRLLRDLKREE